MIIASPLLTIAIPTWQRASFLALTLAQLHREVTLLSSGLSLDQIEIVVSDNGSTDNTLAVVESVQSLGFALRYVRNAENMGSDANIAQCFNLAQGQYVMILGDDDLLVDGALSWLLQTLMRRTWGVVCLRPYGFESDFRREYPGAGGKEIEFSDAGDFLAAIGSFMTLISSCVINKSLLVGQDAREFCGGNLVQVHLVIRAALKGEHNLFVRRYWVACQRNNSGGYDFAKVFVLELGRVLDSYHSAGLSAVAIYRLETRLLLSYYPFYMLRQQLGRSGDMNTTFAYFSARFGHRWLFRLWLAPILQLPRPLALLWGAGVTLIGRIISGDLRRGMAFIRNRLHC